jgi:hypothetical protein
VRRGRSRYVWDFAGRRNTSQHLTDAVSAIAPDAIRPSLALKSGSTSRKALAELFCSAGLKHFETKNLVIAATFTDVEDYWTSNTKFKAPTANVCCSLAPSQLQAAQKRLRETLPRGAKGKIVVSATHRLLKELFVLISVGAAKPSVERMTSRSVPGPHTTCRHVRFAAAIGG